MADGIERTEVAPGVHRLGARLEQVVAGARVRGVAGPGPVDVVAVTWHGSNAITVVYRDPQGGTAEALLYRDHEPALGVEAGGAQPFDADGSDFKLAAEAQRIRLAGLFDPMLAVSTSDIDPLPHQLKAVYGELLPRTPLRFLLADDPGAGKTIMAGLYIKELLLRGDLERCLIVAPGSLVEQWQDELAEKFGLRFDLLSRQLLDDDVDGTVFQRHPRLIARMDQLSRSPELQERLAGTDWDLVVVDEAHRMSAHYFGNELKTTKRYQLGQLLGRVARHLLLMTATPHAGKQEDFQLFMALLDGDRFEGKYRDGVHAVDVGGLMRRMVKEELLTFDGKPLFPERRASTVPYRLSERERELYEAVSDYVRDEMNRADRLKAEGEGRRANTIGFALTVMQRRLASSPEAIWRSLERRRKRLERRRHEMLAEGGRGGDFDSRLAALLGRGGDDDLADQVDDLLGEEQEALEEEVVDAATAARTAAELEVEIGQLAALEELARRVRMSGEDVKWTQLRRLLLDEAAIRDERGDLRKIIIFTEHRDTLNYLVEQIGSLIGRPEAVRAIHGGVRREERRKVQELFTQDKEVAVLVATDAAGEGLNLQRAHLMVNYDLPWNPNRIEQRFGRIHRIGQTEVCHLWNLVAEDTREGAVFQRLLDKIEEQRAAYDGKVFDVLGDAFAETPLRDLLMQAIRYGDRPEVRDKLNQVIDASVADGIDELMAERALAHEAMGATDLHEYRTRLELAKARRLQPHYIRSFFAEAFTRLGGRMAEREAGRFEIAHVPAAVRDRDRQIGAAPAPVLARYERVTFERELRRVPGLPPAELIAPGHPLLDAVVDLTIERWGSTLRQGAVLVDATDAGETPRLLVALAQEIADGQTPPAVVSKRFDYVEVLPDGSAAPAGPAPYLDYDPLAPADMAVRAAVEAVAGQPWLAAGPDGLATDWAVEHGGREHLDDVRARLLPELARTREQVRARLLGEINFWDTQHAALLDQEAAGRQLRIRPETAEKRARDLERRLEARLAELEARGRITPRPPRVVGAALVIPQGLIDRAAGARTEPVATFAVETAEVERRAVDAVLAAERALGRDPHEQAHNHPGFDVLSFGPDGEAVTIEVKGRRQGATDVIITKNEVLIGKNKGASHRLALVAVHPDGFEQDELRYLVDPFATSQDPGFGVTKLIFDWGALWGAGGEPV